MSRRAKYDITLDAAFAALADPTRRAMLNRLSRGPATATELAATTGIALPTCLKHVTKLEAGGLVLTEKDGRARRCRLAPGAFGPVTRWLTEREAEWTARLDRFDDYATRIAEERKDGPRS